MRDAASCDERDERSADERIDDADVRRRTKPCTDIGDGHFTIDERTVAITDRRARRRVDFDANVTDADRTDDGADHRADNSADSRANPVADGDPVRAATDRLHRP